MSEQEQCTPEPEQWQMPGWMRETLCAIGHTLDWVDCMPAEIMNKPTDKYDACDWRIHKEIATIAKLHDAGLLGDDKYKQVDNEILNRYIDKCIIYENRIIELRKIISKLGG